MRRWFASLDTASSGTHHGVRRLRATARLAVVAICLFFAGCGKSLDDTYGQRTGPGADKSVNGTRVFGEMFEKAGHRVLTWTRLSPKLWNRADCIVWFPDNFHPPGEETRDWLETWLAEKPDRAVIYVGRDFDAATWYWDKIEPQVPAEQRKAYEEHRRIASRRWAMDRAGMPQEEKSPWFDVDRRPDKRSVRTLAGNRDWLDGVDPAKLEVELHWRIRPPKSADVLLESEGDAIVSRQALGQGHLYVVANGSFLLNLPLVNHEHRKLAAKLVDTTGDEKRTVVFLESGTGGPSIVDDDPLSGMPTGVEIFNVWPTNWILLHLAVVGILFCFWRYPIFGTAASGEPAPLSDFGKHLDAVGELLKQSGDEEYARGRVKEYVQKIRGDGREGRRTKDEG
jgi:hypothetical protein